MAEKKKVVDEKALQKIWIKSYLGQYYWARNKKDNWNEGCRHSDKR